MRPPRRPDLRGRVLPRAIALAALVAAGHAGALPAEPVEDLSTPGSGGALRVTADPPRLVLGTDGGADLRIQAPAAVQELTLTASVGRIEALRRLPEGGFTARYRPPPERYPQVALVVAAVHGAAGPLDGWLAIPLHGQGDARVKAPPGERASLVVAGRTFGPVRAGEDGTALIPLVVPPGVREGHQGFRPIDLRVPETSLLHASLEPHAVAADRVERVRVLAYVVAPHGAARRGDQPAFEPTRGTVAVRAREPGAYEATWTLPPGPAAEERLTVRLPGSPASRQVLSLTRAAGPPAAVAIAFDREALVAGETDAVGVIARAVDAAGNPVPAALEFASDDGVIEAAPQVAPDARDARLVLGPRFDGRRAVVVTVRAPALGLVSERVLPLRPAAPAEARLSDERVLVADGAREARLSVRVLDRFENDTGLAPRVSVAVGRVAAVEADRTGGYEIRYVGPAVRERTPERLALDVTGLHAEAALTLVPPRGPRGAIVSAGALADARGRFGGLLTGFALEVDAGRVGAAAPRGVDLAARVDAELMAHGPGPGATVTPADSGETSAGGAATTAATFLAGFAASHELRAGPTVFASAGVGVHLARVDAGDAGRLTGGAPAGRLGVGVGFRRRGGMPFVEASVLAVGAARRGRLRGRGVLGRLAIRSGGPPWRPC